MPGVDPTERPTVVGGDAPPPSAWPEREPLYGDTVVGGPPPGPPPPVEPPLPPDGRSLDRSLAIGLIVLLLLVAGGIALAVLLSRNDDDKNAQQSATTRSGVTAPPLTEATPTSTGTRVGAIVAVPRVMGQREAAAKARLRAQGLGSHVQPRAGARKGFVVEQLPPAGAKLRRGSAITLVVGAGRPGGAAAARVPVPRVVGLTEDQAATRLEASRLQPRSRRSPTSSRPAGTVLLQSPAAGARVNRGSPVVLTVAQAPPKATVPDVVGQPRLAAIAALRKARVGWRQHMVPSQEKPGTVIAQFPQAGAVVPQGTPVRLNIAVQSGGGGGGGTTTPASGTAVPDVTSMDEQTAISDLKAAGFHAQTTPEAVTDESQDGIVLDQDPAAGTRATKGGTITLTVGRYSG